MKRNIANEIELANRLKEEAAYDAKNAVVVPPVQEPLQVAATEKPSAKHDKPGKGSSKTELPTEPSASA